MRLLFIACLASQLAVAQFAPPQGQVGSTAIYQDSSVFIAWATSCKITRGLQNISSASSGYATVGDSTSPVGIADGTVVSLGDGGSAICSFKHTIYDGPGYDFAVFENSFDGNYLELGFVEVSSDGINFFRFPTTSNTQDTSQTGGFGDTDAKKLNNLAGKYITQYGTPFDLSEMQGINGLDIQHITDVKVIDVVGSISSLYATYDKNNNKVNDPWPTPFPSGGFDLDAVGVINQQASNSIQLYNDKDLVSVYPNPAKDKLFISSDKTAAGANALILIRDIKGSVIIQKEILFPKTDLDVSMLENGVYLLQMKSYATCITQKIIISK